MNFRPVGDTHIFSVLAFNYMTKGVVECQAFILNFKHKLVLDHDLLKVESLLCMNFRFVW